MLQTFKNNAITQATLSQADVRQRELDFYTNNYLTWGSTSTVMAGFVFSQLTNPVPPETPFMLEMAYLVLITICLGLNLCVITWTMLCCIWGPGMALRGPDGMDSFHQVINFLKEEQNTVYNSFMVSVFCYFGSTCCLVWVYPSSNVTNMAMMVIFAAFLVMVVILQVGLELRIGGSILSHEGPDGRIQGLGALEGLDDLDNHVGAAMPDAIAYRAELSGMY
eukprot:TRINITY_DN32868_c0_g1_i1.p1 TRINITY_DN32868_c0_g1~~TRINITY_DN32868_c0_g1_i1.p1  ORF type:complete len:222 (-),score=48.29 TRINITY_DN32868_c0_g1_i1:61-726(-)